MILVVDASVAVKWLIEEPDHIAARRLLESNEELQAPDFVLIETGNVLWKKVRRGELTKEQAAAGLDALPRLFDSMVPSSLLIARALQLAIELSHLVYDCLYLACAEHAGGDLVTADARFAARARTISVGPRARTLSDLGEASP